MRNIIHTQKGIYPVILVLYIDDMIIADKKKSILNALKDQLKSAFAI